MKCQNCNRELEKYEIIKDLYNNDSCAYCGFILREAYLCYDCNTRGCITPKWGGPTPDIATTICCICSGKKELCDFCFDANKKNQEEDYFLEKEDIH